MELGNELPTEECKMGEVFKSYLIFFNFYLSLFQSVRCNTCK